MPSTSRMLWEYPTEEQKDWWAIFVALINQQDSDVWASIENAYLVLSGGGSVSLDASANTLTWTENLYVKSTLSGGRVRILASSVTLNDGETAYIDITRPLSSNYDAVLQTTSTPMTGTNQRNSVLVAIREGSQLIMRPWQGPPTGIFDDTLSTGVVASGGGEWVREIDVHTILKGEVQAIELSSAVPASDDTAIYVYDDDPSGTGELLYSSTGIDVTTAPFYERSVFFIELINRGSLWVKVVNSSASSDTYSFRIRVRDSNEETFGE